MSAVVDVLWIDTKRIGRSTVQHERFGIHRLSLSRFTARLQRSGSDEGASLILTERALTVAFPSIENEYVD